jgi:hypothetical protein
VKDYVVGTEVEEMTLKGVQRPVRIFEITQREVAVPSDVRQTST